MGVLGRKLTRFLKKGKKVMLKVATLGVSSRVSLKKGNIVMLKVANLFRNMENIYPISYHSSIHVMYLVIIYITYTVILQGYSTTERSSIYLSIRSLTKSY